MIGCTAVDAARLARATALAQSFLARNRGAAFVVLLVDGPGLGSARPPDAVETLAPADLGVDPAELRRLQALHEPAALAGVLLPVLARHLLGRGGPVVALDADSLVLAPLHDLAAVAAEHGVVLVATLVEPVPADGRQPDAAEVARRGPVDAGVVAVGPGAEPFLDWWAGMLARHPAPVPGRPGGGWLDLAPVLFDASVLREVGFAAGPWNLAGRTVTPDGRGAWSVDGRPLRVLRLPGFDPARPHLLDGSLAMPRVLLSEQPDLAGLCGTHARTLVDLGDAEARGMPSPLATMPGGVPLDRRMRRLYREALLAVEAGRGETSPGPFDEDGGAAFVAWLNRPAENGRLAPVSRYLGALHAERSDLQHAFPHLDGPDAARFLQWVDRYGRSEVPVPAALAAGAEPLPARPRRPPRPRHPGVNLAGYFRSEAGVGEAARALRTALDAAGIPCTVVPYAGGTPSRQKHPFTEGGEGPAHDVDVVCVNADLMPRFASDMGAEFFAGRYVVGAWMWEVEGFPDWMRRSFDLVDEVWAGSEHTRAILAAVTRKPVVAMPPPVVTPRPDPLSRADLGLDERFTFLFLHDFLSVPERKNPVGLVEAFRRAFTPGEGPVLLLKSVNGDRFLAGLERVRAAAADRPDIRIVDGYLDAGRKDALVAACDCYVSLHRAEGFGLTMAEAMALGRPVIATGYSAPTEFMNAGNSLLVPHRMVPVGPGHDPYPATALWADPDLDEAARLMRWVVEHPDEARALGERGRRDVAQRHSPAVAGVRVARRLAEIARGEGVAAGPAPAAATMRRAAQEGTAALRRAGGRVRATVPRLPGRS